MAILGQLVLFILPALCTCADVFTSVEHLHHLEEAEELMLPTLESFLRDEEDRLNVLETLLDDISVVYDRPESNDTYTFVGHPLNAFHLIKRFIMKWPRIFDVFDDIGTREGFKKLSVRYRGLLPTATDYDGALMAVLRLQKVYNMQTADLSEGWVYHRQALPLGHEHMNDLGVAALNRLHEPRIAEEWLRTARNVERPPRANLDTVDELYRSVREHNERSPPQNQAAESEPVRKYNELCRKSVYQPYVSRDRSVGLECYLHSTTLPYYNHKVEVLHTAPEISLVYDFVSQSEADAVMQLSLGNLTRARVGLYDQSIFSDVRVGKMAFIWDSSDSVVARLSQRVALLTGLNTTYPWGEPLQVVNYGMGGQYDVHYDFDTRWPENKMKSELVQQIGDRLATFMIFLNDVQLGGATVFPEIGVYVRPVARAAVLWYNYDEHGDGDGRTLHGGCPLLHGQKWIANKWIRQGGQELLMPCSVHHKE